MDYVMGPGFGFGFGMFQIMFFIKLRKEKKCLNY